MKNKFLLLLILGVTFFASCNDDDDDKVRTYNGDSLSLSVGGINFSDREAVLNGSVLTLKQALPGENETEFTIIREGNKITGVNSNANREVALNGTIDGDKLGLNLTLKVKSSMKAKWDVKKLFLNVEPEYIVEEGEPDLVGLVGMLGSMVSYIMPNISFEEDGNIVAYYCKDMANMGNPEAYENSPKGMALYNVVDNKIINNNPIINFFILFPPYLIIICVGIPKAESSIGRSDYNPLTSLMAMVDTGLPLYLRDGEEGLKEVYVDREMMLPVVKMLPSLLSAYGDKLGDYKETLEQIVAALVPLVENSEVVELGLQLAPYTEIPTPATNVQSLSKMIENASLKFVK